MAIDTQAEVHVDQVLTNLVLDYGDDTGEFLGNILFPIITVANDTGKYYKWKRNCINITGLNTLRDDRAQAHEVNIDVEISDFRMEQHALREFLPDSIAKNADSILSLRERYAKHVVEMLDLTKEKTMADLAFSASEYDSDHKTTLAGNFRWNQITQTASDPKGDISTAQRTILLTAGVWAQSLVMGFDLYRSLKRHVNILASVQYVQRTGINFITDSEVMDYLGVTKLYVGKKVYNSAYEGETEVNAFVWNTHALLFYESGGGAINVPSFGFEFRPSHTPRTVSRYRPDDLNGEFVEVNEKRWHKITFPKAAYLFINADG